MESSDPTSDFSLDQPVAAEVSRHVRSILGEAEAAATAIRHDAEQQSQQRRRAVEEEAREILAAARREADALVEERVRRISELSDSLWTRAEGLVGRFEQAEDLRAQLGELIDGLGRTAARLAHEANVQEHVGPAEHDDAHEPAPAPEPQPAPEPHREAATGDAAPVAGPDGREPPEVELAGESQPGSTQLRAVGEQEGTPAESQVEEPQVSSPPQGATEDSRLQARLVALQMAVAGGNRGEVEGHLRRAFDLARPETILDDIFGAGSGPDTRVTWPETTPQGPGS
jgi:hypothetical protein